MSIAEAKIVKEHPKIPLESSNILSGKSEKVLEFQPSVENSVQPLLILQRRHMLKQPLEYLVKCRLNDGPIKEKWMTMSTLVAFENGKALLRAFKKTKVYEMGVDVYLGKRRSLASAKLTASSPVAALSNRSPVVRKSLTGTSETSQAESSTVYQNHTAVVPGSEEASAKKRGKKRSLPVESGAATGQCTAECRIASGGCVHRIAGNESSRMIQRTKLTTQPFRRKLNGVSSGKGGFSFQSKRGLKVAATPAKRRANGLSSTAGVATPNGGTFFHKRHVNHERHKGSKFTSISSKGGRGILRRNRVEESSESSIVKTKSEPSDDESDRRSTSSDEILYSIKLDDDDQQPQNSGDVKGDGLKIKKPRTDEDRAKRRARDQLRREKKREEERLERERQEKEMIKPLVVGSNNCNDADSEVQFKINALTMSSSGLSSTSLKSTSVLPKSDTTSNAKTKRKYAQFAVMRRSSSKPSSPLSLLKSSLAHHRSLPINYVSRGATLKLPVYNVDDGTSPPDSEATTSSSSRTKAVAPTRRKAANQPGSEDCAVGDGDDSLGVVGLSMERRVSVRQTENAFKFKEISVRKCAGYMHVVLLSQARGKNVLNPRVLHELNLVLQSSRYDDSRALLLSGSGNVFCSGIDLRYLLSGEEDRRVAAKNLVDNLREFISALIAFPKPIVAAVNGPAVGLGVAILPLCDIIYASDKATFSCPYTALSQTPEGCASYTFPKMMGMAMASEMLLRGRRITALEASQIGLITQVFLPDHLMSEVIPRVQTLAIQSSKTALLQYRISRFLACMASYGSRTQVRRIKERLQWSVYRPTLCRAMESTKALMRAGQQSELEAVNVAETRMLLDRWTSTECQRAMQTYLESVSET